MRRVAAFLTVAWVAALSAAQLAGGVAATAATAAPGGAASDHWANAQVIPAPNQTASTINAVSCGSAGNCVAGGYYENVGSDEAMLVTETDGLWGASAEVPGTAKLNTGGLAQVTSISCASPGNCSAGGFYAASSQDNQEGFVINETNGTWGTAEEIPGLGKLNSAELAGVTVVSCASAGNCAAGGSYQDSSGSFQAFVVSEKGGTWGTAAAVPGTIKLNIDDHANVTSLSCYTAGNCVAVGYYTAGYGIQDAFIDTESNGTWGTEAAVPGISSLSGQGKSEADSVSCPSAGNCTVVGTEWNGTSGAEAAFVVGETGGTWGNAQFVPGVSGLSGAYSWGSAVSCASAGNCSVTGGYGPNSSEANVFVATESGNSWGSATAMPGLAFLDTGGFAQVNSISCGSAGNCTAAGYYSAVSGQPDFHHAAFLDDQIDGSWQPAQQVPGTSVPATSSDAETYSVSCVSASYCLAGGFYTASRGGGFVLARSTLEQSTTSVTLSSATETYGAEQTERISAKVTPAAGGTPTGTVTIAAAGSAICTVRLTAGAASCKLTSTGLPAGKIDIAAGYSGDATFGPSSSAAVTLKVVQDTSKVTSFTLSTTKITYGREGSEHLTARVAAKYAGPPTGSVKVRSGRITVCTMTLKSGKGSCILLAKKLKAGTYHLVASYGGGIDFTSAASGKKTLTVAK